ncbi:uncharacterized protein I206_102379 [Kwoniella pini CBS 10737]|uniref:Sld7 C-terminal domain-containing protein n=1 Tax=Kwoniella pini CBS 10737 TaxID=1296096 RepID=A0A1B9I5A7_9TREE|nr:uncharacterized protein I206_02726 [Kwoniella pini CBS 10737]OCF50671.1 hypothetical protein I206_02726 [Kwoniella pini CBS 10737]
MTTIPSHLSSVGPSPSRNPFARPKLGGISSSSFTRKTLLPSIISPVKSSSETSIPSDNLVTPSSKNGAGVTTPRAKSAWRLLWRGGLEIGNEGFRLDGITFFALLSFPPPTPSAGKEINPFDVPIQNTPGSRNGTFTPGGTGSQSPFPLTSGDTDLCLSLESMRGRKYLQVRGIIDLPPDEVLEGDSDENGNTIQMSISSQAPLLAAYFTGLLCRNEKLNNNGRTVNAILIGLGDEGIDSSTNSTILVYGQKEEKAQSPYEPGTLKLYVGRRKPLPIQLSDIKKVKPGEPLPRAPLFFPAKAPKKPLPLFPTRSLSRTSSVSSSIYQHPQPHSQPQQHKELSRHAQSTTHQIVANRGEKRPRNLDPTEDVTWQRKKSGQVDLIKPVSLNIKMERVSSSTSSIQKDTILSGDRAKDRQEEEEEEEEEEEDIFGKRGKSITPNPPLMARTKSSESTGILNTSEKAISDIENTNGDEGSTNKNKRVRVPQQVLDNKAAIRKQTLVLLENREISRNHELFKEVFGMTTKGTYFTFRDRLHQNQISKIDIQKIVNIHLNMYLPNSQLKGFYIENLDNKIHNKVENLIEINDMKKEEEEEEENYKEIKLEDTFLNAQYHDYDLENKMKLQSVIEEEED